ncbi:MAG TPA: GNAT family N-acetyltransferase [Acidimicrobiales bacterium]
MPSSATTTPVLERLDDDLVLRRAEPADADAVTALNVDLFGAQEEVGVRALLTGDARVEWLVVAAGPDAEQPGAGTIAAACARIPHAFDLDGVAIPGSQIEWVTADPAFRRRGLVRALFRAHHRRADRAGELLQVVGGIPYFYRKFGYGYGFDSPDSYSIAPSAAPTIDPSRVRVREAERTDVDWLLATEAARARNGLTVVRDRGTFETWVSRTDPVEGHVWERLLLAEADGRPVGWLRAAAWPVEAQLFLVPGPAPDLGVAEQLLAHGMAIGADLADHLDRPVEVLASDLPGTPWSRAIQASGRPRPEPSGLYTRTGDEVGLLRQLEPVLSRRLATSGLAHDRGELLLSLYDRGIHLAWEGGRLTAIEAAPPDPDPFDKGGVGVAPDWFAALVLGRWGATGLAARSDDTLLGDHAAVMDVLFPPRPNDVITDL